MGTIAGHIAVAVPRARKNRIYGYLIYKMGHWDMTYG